MFTEQTVWQAIPLLESMVFADRCAGEIMSSELPGAKDVTDRVDWSLYQNLEQLKEQYKNIVLEEIERRKRDMSDTTFMKMNADRYIRMALEEDITSEDISTNCVMPEYQKGQVDLICKQDGVICGLWVFQRVFELLDDTVTFDMKVKEGDFVHAGDLMAVVTGDIRTLLSGERTALNYLQRMSGIATYTHEIAQLLEGSHTTLLDTRKTTRICVCLRNMLLRLAEEATTVTICRMV